MTTAPSAEFTLERIRSFLTGESFVSGDPVLERDELTGALAVIDTVHHEAHEGELFSAAVPFASIANNAYANLLVTVPANGHAHLDFSCVLGGAAWVYLYESPVNVTAGAAIATYNHKRGDTVHTSPITLNAVSAVTDPGTVALVNGRYVAGGTSQQTRSGGEGRAQMEWILKPNTTYLIRAQNVSGAAVAGSIEVAVYED